MKSRIAAVLLATLALQAGVWAADPPKGAVTVSWIGNSAPGAAAWVQQDIRTIFVSPDGTVYANAEWEEGGGQVGVYRDGRQVARAGHTHGWGQLGGEAIAVNEKYVYIGQLVHNEGGGLRDPGTWPPKGKRWFGVSRRLRSDITKPASFHGGKGGKGDTLERCFLVVHEAPEKEKAHVKGLAADGQRLYVSDARDGRIRVYDAETMESIGGWALASPGSLALDRKGMLWVLQTGGGERRSRLLRFQPDGAPLPQRVDFDEAQVPTAFCADDRGRLLVTDDGEAQQILVYDDAETSPRLAGAFGERGGIYAGKPGLAGPLRFNRPTGVGTDAQGNIYVACDGQTGGGGTVLESYRPDGTRNWQLLGLEFVDMADLDPASDADVYTKEEHFTLDRSRPRGQEWAYRGYTLDPFRYPEDPRLHLWSAGAWVRRIKGRRTLFVTDMNAGFLQVYRFDPDRAGEIAIPCGFFAPRHFRSEKGEPWPPYQPAQGAWLWRDANGNGRFDAGEYMTREGRDVPEGQGWWVDSVGNVWRATETEGIIMFPLKGLDEHGSPEWDFVGRKTFPKPPQFDRVKRLRYDAAQDVMYLGGTTSEHTNQHWKPMGPVVCRYDGWSRGQAKPRWQFLATYAKGSHGHESCEPMGFDVAGDYVFLPYTGASREVGFRTGHVEIVRASDGTRVGAFEPSADIGEIGLQDIRECLAAHQLADGAYEILLEEDFKAKIVVYRWRPADSPSTR